MNTFKAILVAISILATPAVGIGAEQPNATKAVSLEDRLKTGLRARRPEEFAFIEDVVSLVQRGELPGKIVDSTFIWAIQHQRKYPFPAFERALRVQADKIGVGL